MRVFPGYLAAFYLMLHSATVSCAQYLQNGYPLEISIGSQNQLPYIQFLETTNCLIELESTSDWKQWVILARTLHQLINYPDYRFNDLPRQFYRIKISPIPAVVPWKNQVYFPSDYFLSEEKAGPSQLRWIKFLILLDEPYRVYYQNSRQYLFHYDFAKANIAAFQKMDPLTFEESTLYTNKQVAVLGALIYPPAGTEPDYGIQFLGYDQYSPKNIANWYHLIRATVNANTNVIAYYLPAIPSSYPSPLPTDTNSTSAIPTTSLYRWIYRDLIYSPGWAAGILKYFSSDQISQAVADGQLTAADILITSDAPTSLPSVAGIIVLNPATPNSHIAILSRSFGIPLVCFKDIEKQLHILSYTNRAVVLRAYEAPVSILDVFPLSADDTSMQMVSLRMLKAPPQLKIENKSSWGNWTANVDDLNPTHLKYFGGKASTYGILRRAIPDHARPALAFSIDLWDAFMSQPFGKQTLKEAITDKISSHTNTMSLNRLQADLAEIRSWITEKAVWPSYLQKAITNTLAARFAPNMKIRFRSSSNAEDTEYFSGAGLYDSYSGCLADDMDSDELGPSHADPTEKNERGVFRAIQKVYASLYTERAFRARLDYQISEDQIGMGLLVHESFPDEVELANGVATAMISDNGRYYSIVSQQDAISVAKPETGISAEEVTGQQIGPFLSMYFKSASSLVPLGQKVLVWESDYRQLCDLFTTVAQTYQSYFTNKKSFILDFEFKKITNGRLFIKQVREMPSNNALEKTPIYLLGKEAKLMVFQDEYSDLFSNHRLKSTWQIKPQGGPVLLSIPSQKYIQYMKHSRYIGDGVLEQEVHPEAWELIQTASQISYFGKWPSRDEGYTTLNSLLFTFQKSVPAGQTLRVLEDCRIGLHSFHNRPVSDIQLTYKVNYPQLMPKISPDGEIRFTNEESVALTPPIELASDCPLQIRSFNTNQIFIQTRYYWPRPPLEAKTVGGYVDGYTPVLIKFDETRIEGLTDVPVVLKSEYSQTYRPGHHVFYEEFLFEPRVDSNLSALQQAQLSEKQIRYFYFRYSPTNSIIRLMDFQGNSIRSF